MGADDDTNEAPAPGAAPGGARCGCRVLVVDDSPMVAELFAELLQELGHEVRVAHDGLFALEQANGFVPHVVFSDISMPGMSGYELARRLRTLPALARTVLVAMTGYSQEADRRAALEAGFHRHLVKPADIASLEEVFASVAWD